MSGRAYDGPARRLHHARVVRRCAVDRDEIVALLERIARAEERETRRWDALLARMAADEGLTADGAEDRAGESAAA